MVMEERGGWWEQGCVSFCFPNINNEPPSTQKQFLIFVHEHLLSNTCWQDARNSSKNILCCHYFSIRDFILLMCNFDSFVFSICCSTHLCFWKDNFSVMWNREQADITCWLLWDGLQERWPSTMLVLLGWTLIISGPDVPHRSTIVIPHTYLTYSYSSVCFMRYSSRTVAITDAKKTSNCAAPSSKAQRHSIHSLPLLKTK